MRCLILPTCDLQDDDDDEDGRLVVPGAKKSKKAPVPPSGATPASHQDPQVGSCIDVL
jgi:hypothetical protein